MTDPAAAQPVRLSEVSGRADITSILNDHSDYTQTVNSAATTSAATVWMAVCRCGERLTDTTNGPLFGQRHRAHVAAILAARAPQPDASAALAEVWDEAAQAVAWALDNGPVDGAAAYVAAHNPYRAHVADAVLAVMPQGGTEMEVPNVG